MLFHKVLNKEKMDRSNLFHTMNLVSLHKRGPLILRIQSTPISSRFNFHSSKLFVFLLYIIIRREEILSDQFIRQWRLNFLLFK
jgi:hypothetical protein